MSNRSVKPGRLEGKISIPGDKSISHRAAILNSIAEGEALVENFLEGEDCLNTIACLRALGIRIEPTGAGAYRIRGVGLDGLKEPTDILDVGNSGTAIRLLAGLLAGLKGTAILTGDASIRRRPMGRVTEPLKRMGALVNGRERGGFAPLALTGGSIVSMEYDSPVASAQVKTAILLAGLFAEGVTSVNEPSRSRDHTERMLKAMGADIRIEGNRISLEGRPRLLATNIVVPGDLSSAAFWLVGASIHPGSKLQISNVGVNPTRTGLIDALASMGAGIELGNEREICGEPVADLEVTFRPLQGTVIEGSLIPRLIDEIPILALAAACAEGKTVIRDAKELRLKESDRIRSTAESLRAFGANIVEHEDGMTIEGPTAWKKGQADSGGDHRIAMTLAIAGLFEGAEVLDTACTDTSYPLFWETLERVSLR